MEESDMDEQVEAIRAKAEANVQKAAEYFQSRLKAATIKVTATGNTTIAGSTDLGAAAALSQRDKNISGAFDDLTRKEARRAERTTIHDAAVARYQQETGKVVRDKAQTQFEREIA